MDRDDDGNEAFGDVSDQSENSVTLAGDSGDIGGSNISTPSFANIDSCQRAENITSRHRAKQIGGENQPISFHRIEASFTG